MRQLFTRELPKQTSNEIIMRNEQKKGFLRHQETYWHNVQPASLLQNFFRCFSSQTFKNTRSRLSLVEHTFTHIPILIFLNPTLLNFMLRHKNDSHSFFPNHSNIGLRYEF